MMRMMIKMFVMVVLKLFMIIEITAIRNIMISIIEHQAF